jgi:hypothetical protein
MSFTIYLLCYRMLRVLMCRRGLDASCHGPAHAQPRQKCSSSVLRQPKLLGPTHHTFRFRWACPPLGVMRRKFNLTPTPAVPSSPMSPRRRSTCLRAKNLPLSSENSMFGASPLAPPSSSSCKRLVPKKTKLSLLGSSNSTPKEGDLLDAVYCVDASSTTHGSFAIHVDPTEDHELARASNSRRRAVLHSTVSSTRPARRGWRTRRQHRRLPSSILQTHLFP